MTVVAAVGADDADVVLAAPVHPGVGDLLAIRRPHRVVRAVRRRGHLGPRLSERVHVKGEDLLYAVPVAPEREMAPVSGPVRAAFGGIGGGDSLRLGRPDGDDKNVPGLTRA